MKSGIIMQRIRILPVFVFLLFANPAQSALVHLPGGATVEFYYDDTLPGMAAYGTLSVVGDSIFATPSGILAESNNGGTVTYPSSGTPLHGMVIVVVKPGYQFDTVAVAQQGDYRVSGNGAGVSVTSTLTVEDSSNAGTSETGSMAVTGLGLNNGQLNGWSSFAQFDLTTATWDGVTSIDLTLDSLLTAVTSASGESALIQNKQTGGGLITVETAVVPVPASILLLVSGLLGLSGVVKRGI